MISLSNQVEEPSHGILWWSDYLQLEPFIKRWKANLGQGRRERWVLTSSVRDWLLRSMSLKTSINLAWASFVVKLGLSGNSISKAYIISTLAQNEQPPIWLNTFHGKGIPSVDSDILPQPYRICIYVNTGFFIVQKIRSLETDLCQSLIHNYILTALYQIFGWYTFADILWDIKSTPSSQKYVMNTTMRQFPEDKQIYCVSTEQT